MSTEATYLASKVTDLKPNTKFVLMALADKADYKMTASIDQKTIAAWCNMSKKTVIKHLKILAEKGLISIINRRYQDGENNGRQSKNVYKINLQEFPSEARVKFLHPTTHEPPLKARVKFLHSNEKNEDLYLIKGLYKYNPIANYKNQQQKSLTDGGVTLEATPPKKKPMPNAALYYLKMAKQRALMTA